jgi:hypothetical protein
MQFAKLDVAFESFETTSAFEERILANLEDLSNSFLLVDINLPNEDGDVFVERFLPKFELVEQFQIVFLTEHEIRPSLLSSALNIQKCIKTDVVSHVQKSL